MWIIYTVTDDSIMKSMKCLIILKIFVIENFSAHGINDFIHLPVTDENMNQVLLKWAGQKLSEGKC